MHDYKKNHQWLFSFCHFFVVLSCHSLIEEATVSVAKSEHRVHLSSNTASMEENIKAKFLLTH